MAFEIVRNDITRVKADAIVNTANPLPVVGAGTDFAIHSKAGPELLAARQAAGRIAVGHAAVTPAFGLDARYVIHAVGPVWEDGNHGEEQLLRQTYESALQLALEYHCRSIAFPLLSSGSYGFPKDRALSVAIHACHDFLLHHRMHITLAVFHEKAFALSEQLVSEVRSYVDEHYVTERFKREYGNRIDRRRGMAEQKLFGQLPCEAPSCPIDADDAIERLKENLARRLEERKETFTESMLRIIREKDLLDTEVYGRILMDRKTFNKIRNAPDHHPQKKTAIQLAIALRLNEDEARDLIAKAGYAFSDSSRSDLIILYCIRDQIYDIDTIDGLLESLGEKALFSIR